jgi:hypothetical protein
MDDEEQRDGSGKESKERAVSRPAPAATPLQGRDSRM